MHSGCQSKPPPARNMCMMKAKKKVGDRRDDVQDVQRDDANAQPAVAHDDELVDMMPFTIVPRSAERCWRRAQHRAGGGGGGVIVTVMLFMWSRSIHSGGAQGGGGADEGHRCAPRKKCVQEYLRGEKRGK